MIHVWQVLEWLKAASFYLKHLKCEFCAKKTGFVSYIITPDSIEIEPDSIFTVAKWPMPASHRDIFVFLGFASFYWYFIQNFSKIAKLMSDVLKGRRASKFNTVFQAPPEMLETFCRLLQAFIEAPDLIHYEVNKPICIETDSSGYVIVRITSQLVEWDGEKAANPSAPRGGKPSLRDWHPVAF